MYIYSKLCHWMWKFGLEASRFQTLFHASTVLGPANSSPCSVSGMRDWMAGQRHWDQGSPGSEEHSQTWTLMGRVCSTPAADVRTHYWTLSQIGCFYIPKPLKTRSIGCMVTAFSAFSCASPSGHACQSSSHSSMHCQILKTPHVLLSTELHLLCAPEL